MRVRTRRRTQKAVAIVVAIAIVLALLLSLLAVFSGTAESHAEMRQSAPRPTQVVGGVVNRVEMEFREPIRPHESNQVVLEYPDGTREQTAVTVNGRLVRGRFTPLTEPGQYKVIWGLVDDADNDWTTEEFPFTYDPTAAAPEWLPDSAAGSSDDGDGIGGTVLIVVIIAVAAALAGWLFWPRQRKSARRKRRR